MSHYLLLNRIKVQNANAITGFTWGFPAITHFLGFTHLLARKLADSEEFSDIRLLGCAVIAHQHQVHTYTSSMYGEHEFTQSRNPPYTHLAKGDSQKNKKMVNTAAVIEEGKMNMTVSLLIACDGYIGDNAEPRFIQWLLNNCLMQRLAGGTILNIKQIERFPDNAESLHKIKRRLLPGFVLQEQTQHLEKRYQVLLKREESSELLDALLDFCCLKQQARPKSDVVSKHIQQRAKQRDDPLEQDELLHVWEEHIKQPYQQDNIPESLKQYFATLDKNSHTAKLLAQWEQYCTPTEDTDADWEYVAKPESGYLIPIMVGYKAISEVQDNKKIANTRDNETDVCFVEAVHSIGEWQSVHRLKTCNDLSTSLWHYHYEENWYLCTQSPPIQEITEEHTADISTQNPDDDF